jgi:uncharacterized protein YqjF (DUF2071 family)
MPTLTAPVGLMTGRRRPTRPWHVLVTIEDLLIVTWDVPAHAMTPLLPDGLRPGTRDGRAMLSAALFRNRALRAAWLPVPRFGCSQLNIRIYLTDRDDQPGAVFFHALCVGSPPLARVARPLTRVPFRVLPFDIDVDRSGPALSWRASSHDGQVRVAAHDASSSTLPDPATLDLLTNVHTGYVAAPGSPLRTWSIWHRHQNIRLMSVDELRLAPLAELGLGLGNPVWAFYIEAVDYEVYLPARPVPAVGRE